MKIIKKIVITVIILVIAFIYLKYKVDNLKDIQDEILNKAHPKQTSKQN